MVYKFGEFEADYKLTIGALARFGDKYGCSLDQLASGRVDLFAKLLWCCITDPKQREDNTPDDIFGDLELSDLQTMAEAIAELTGTSTEEAKKKRGTGRSSASKQE